jgi:hypothetical protein
MMKKIKKNRRNSRKMQGGRVSAFAENVELLLKYHQ